MLLHNQAKTRHCPVFRVQSFRVRLPLESFSRVLGMFRSPGSVDLLDLE